MSETGGEAVQPAREGTANIPESVRGALASYAPLAPGQVFPEAPAAEAVRVLIESCRRNDPDATHDEIVHFIHEKGAAAKRDRVPDPVSWLFTSVPECFAGEEVGRYRKMLAEQAARAEAAKERADEGWICPQCNVFVTSPQISDKKKRVCRLGHEVEKPMGFWGGLFGIAMFIVFAALASHLAGWIWNIPARLLNAFTVGAGTSFLPLYFFVKGMGSLFGGGPARRLAGGQFGGMLGGALIFLLILHAMTAAMAPACFTPDKPYYSDSSWERVYRFFLPYGMMFGSGCE